MEGAGNAFKAGGTGTVTGNVCVHTASQAVNIAVNAQATGNLPPGADIAMCTHYSQQLILHSQRVGALECAGISQIADPAMCTLHSKQINTAQCQWVQAMQYAHDVQSR